MLSTLPPLPRFADPLLMDKPQALTPDLDDLYLELVFI